MPEAPVRARGDEGGAGGGSRRDRSRPPAVEPVGVPTVDDHCHLEMADGDDWLPVDQALSRAAEAGIDRVVQIGCDLDSARWTVEAVDRYPQLLGGVALHPNEAPRLAAQGRLDDALTEIDALAAHPRVRCVGETGLDHFRTEDAQGHRTQEESFRAHIAMAKAHGKALQIHDRDAHADVLRVLREEGAPERTVFHCFSGDADMARECVQQGYHLSVAGTVTFKNAQGLRDALAQVPLELMTVETDAPFLTPAPFRGRPNASYLVPLTVRALAEVKGVGADEVAAATSATAERLYGPW